MNSLRLQLKVTLKVIKLVSFYMFTMIYLNAVNTNEHSYVLNIPFHYLWRRQCVGPTADYNTQYSYSNISGFG